MMRAESAAGLSGQPGVFGVPWVGWLVIALAIAGWVIDDWARHPEKIPARKQNDQVFLSILARGVTTVSAASMTCLSLTLLLAVATGWDQPTGWVRVAGFALMGLGGAFGAAGASIFWWRRPLFLIPYAQRTEEERRR